VISWFQAFAAFKRVNVLCRYAAAGVIGLTKTIAREYAGRNINCNAVAPGGAPQVELSRRLFHSQSSSVPMLHLVAENLLVQQHTLS
jgi:NAD(P)-dependent dehydrogenase (short-subunit alcohol dehydrogenase family)